MSGIENKRSSQSHHMPLRGRAHTLANGPEFHVRLEPCDALTVEAPHIVGARSIVCAHVLEAFINICRTGKAKRKAILYLCLPVYQYCA